MAVKQNQFPKWYWHSLHDAQIMKNVFAENQLELYIDSEGALGEDITKITLYRYKIVSGRLPDCQQERTYWLRDHLTVLSPKMYQLTLVLAYYPRNSAGRESSEKHIQLEIQFADGKVERKTI